MNLERIYRENLLQGVNSVLTDIDENSPYFDLYNQIQHNIRNFAMKKAYKVTGLVKVALKEDKGLIKAKNIIKLYNNYQTAEYNTAVARTRTAKQWVDFNQDDNKLLFPNIMWIESRSSEQRALHKSFAGKVWAKNDPFWNIHQPGSLWQCKCDWQETAEEVNGKPLTDSDKNLKTVLNVNPGLKGEIFKDSANTYVKDKIAFINAVTKNKDLGYYPISLANGTEINVHLLHGVDEVAKNIKMAQIYCDNHNVKKFYLLPNLNAKAKYKKQFYGKLYKNNIKQKNADALVVFNNTKKQLVEFKEVLNYDQAILNLNKAHKQADTAVLLFNENLSTQMKETIRGRISRNLGIYENTEKSEIKKILNNIKHFELYDNKGKCFFKLP